LLSDAYLDAVLRLSQERIDTLEDFFAYAGFFFTGEVAWDEAALKAMVPRKGTAAETAKALQSLLEDRIDAILDWKADVIEAALRSFAEAIAWKPKEAFMAVRVAVTGRAATPPLFETMELLGKEVCRRRLRGAVEVLGKVGE
jgi:glutamyl-tRNA synthetase